MIRHPHAEKWTPIRSWYFCKHRWVNYHQWIIWCTSMKATPKWWFFLNISFSFSFLLLTCILRCDPHPLTPPNLPHLYDVKYVLGRRGLCNEGSDYTTTSKEEKETLWIILINCWKCSMDDVSRTQNSCQKQRRKCILDQEEMEHHESTSSCKNEYETKAKK